MLLSAHIIAGALAIVLGAVALVVKKGGTIHRRSGMLFVLAMLVMGITASVLELLHGTASANVVAAILTLYFVGTAWTTVRPATRWSRALDVTALLVASGLVMLFIFGGLKGISSSLAFRAAACPFARSA